MSNNIILKKDCITVIKPNNVSIHPLINKLINNTKEYTNVCLTIPFINNNNILYLEDEKILKNRDIDIKLDLNEKKNENDDFSKKLDPINNFSFPINSNNFLEIVFGINSIQKLYEWFENYDLNDINTINLVLDQFWYNNGDIITENTNDFILFNQKLIKLLLDTNIDIDNVTKIIDKLIKDNYGKKIKYIHKIKKYLNEYI